ncbi:MAG: siderophore-interacting protein [Pseudomonadota bacterium]
MRSTEYPHEAQADLPGVAFAPMRQIILAQAKATNLTVLEDASDRLTVESEHGLIGLRPGQSTETAGMVAAIDSRWLFVMKNAVVAQMRHLMPEVVEAMRWSDAGESGGLPPNFSFVRVRSVEHLGPAFLRVTLEGEDLSAHGDQAIHFRLVLPPKDVAPKWPGVAANGSIKWPEGPDAPHRPVYTSRSVDHGTHTLIMDVFVHEGGRTTAWAKEVMAGTRGRSVVGIVGPSGGGLLPAKRVLMASDETGFPAAARLLENLPDGATGDVFLEAEDGSNCNYPLDIPDGINLTWLSRQDGDCLADATLSALPRYTNQNGAKVWFAGEREEAARLRTAAQAAGWNKSDLRISGFWKAQEKDREPSLR